MTPSKVSIGGGNFPASHGDSRGDLGYGRLNPKYHVQKMLGNDSFPYRDQDEDLEDVETFLDEEEEEDLHDMIDSPQDYDPFGGHYDPFSFAGSNTSLHGPSHIGENFAKNSMVPFPKLHNRRGNQTVGGTKSGTARGEGSTMSATIDTGDRWGWSNPLYKEIDTDFENEYNYTLEDIASVDEEAKLRECIRLFIMEYS
jgi:hypothetical protein